jgi:choline kinase
MSRRDAAVVLGAGLGSRLHPHTADRPKCAVELAGEPLAARVIRQLHERGLRRATVVVGHMADRARELLGAALAGLDLELAFVENAEYATTNTMYSALLAMPVLAGGGYLIEGDIAASDQALDRLVGASPSTSWWAADRWTAAHSGSRLRTGTGRRIVGQEIWREATVGDTANLWKSAGMLALDARGAAALTRALTIEAEAGCRTIYYDDVIGGHVADIDLDILDLSGAAWVEIDDADDLAEARRLFERPEPA